MVAQPGVDINARCGGASQPLLSPLHLASLGGRASCVSILLRHHADVNETAGRARTPLHMSAEGGGEQHAACLRLLLRYGSDPFRTDLEGWTASDLAEEACEKARGRECAQVLLPYSRARYCQREHGELHPKPFVSVLLLREQKDLPT